jgi:glutathione S-transferase
VDLYFSPLACSLASRIVFYELGVPAKFIEVDPKTKRTSEDEDFVTINPLALVPTLRTDDRDILTENAAILQYVARRHPQAGLLPSEEPGLMRAQQWLSFLSTELHKGLFIALLDKKAPEGAKKYARDKYLPRLDIVEHRLSGHEFLLDTYSVADAYLLAILNWTAVTAIDLSRWPGTQAYVKRLRERPAVARAMAEERDLYMKEQARHSQTSL